VIAGLILLQAALSIAVAGPATNPEYLPVHVAAAEGYFSDEQIRVSIETDRAEPVAAQALGRGRVAAAATSLDAALQYGASGGGTPPRVVFGLTIAPPVAVLVPAAQKDTIRALSDLVGKTVGIAAPGTPGELALFALLERERIDVHRVTIQSFGERGLAGALESGAIAAAAMPDPWASRLLDEGRAVAMVDLRKPDQAAKWLGGPTVHAAVFVSADTKLGRAELSPFARAMLRAVARTRAATPEELAAKLPPAVVGSPEDFALRLRGARDNYLADGRVDADVLKLSIGLIRSRVVIPAKVTIPRNLDKLLLMEPLEQNLKK
jgi:ABC-type nitrate/sulfonate/bicarbonate transport system substrate-binding protein